ncbi:MAG: replication initiator protein [Microvirus sp.]|nr:MAG: replication initiator protein [Microvirus sp.]
MTCYSPIQAFAGSVVNDATGKRPMVFSRQGSHSGVRQMLPCGRCIGCRLEFSRRWAVRIVHESKLHKENCFLTLTYGKETLPECGTLVPADLQLFHKRLHNRLLDSRGFGIRYYGVGEYGDISYRPHYHSIIFGFDFPDKVIYSRSAKDKTLYESKMLSDVWGKGLALIGEVNFETAAYVARYCLKKVNGKKREEGHYLVYDADGVVHERVPEFAHMSRRPGVGAGYFDKFGAEIRHHDSLIVNGHEVPSIRYYDLKIPEAELELIKRQRRANGVWLERQVDRRQVKERLALITVREKGRPL